jgi:hypothetical protein
VASKAVPVAIGVLALLVGAFGVWRVAEGLLFAWGIEGLLVAVGATAAFLIVVACAIYLWAQRSSVPRTDNDPLLLNP